MRCAVNRTSRIQASWALQQQFEGLTLYDRAILSVPGECIILRGDHDMKPVEYDDSDETNRMRADLTADNELL